MTVFCQKCLYSNQHPLNLSLYDGICSGCLVHQEKYNIDWAQRLDALLKIAKHYRAASKTTYDCIVPVSAGKDSFFIVDYVKNILKLNPLLLVYNTHYLTDVGSRNLARLRTRLDCDLMMQTIDPTVIKKITKATLRKHGSIYWHVQAGQTVYPVQMATRLKIPLIIWGAHQGIDQVGMFSHNEFVEMNERFRIEHDLMGVTPSSLVSEADNIKYEDIELFEYPNPNELASIGVRGIYLNNYVMWDSRKQHIEMAEKYHYDTDACLSTYDIWNDVHCSVYNNIHDKLRYLKFGYTKVVEHLTREIRLGYLNRDQASVILSKYDPEQNGVSFKHFSDWLGISTNALEHFFDKHRNRKIFYRDLDTWEWKAGHESTIFSRITNSGNHTPAIELQKQTSKTESSDVTKKYILLPRGVI